MKEKKVKLQETLTEVLTPEVGAPPTPVRVEMVERLTEGDKSSLDLAKAKRETALEKAKTALAQNEVAELTYNNVILQLAMKYHLNDGDKINEDGSIERKAV